MINAILIYFVIILLIVLVILLIVIYSLKEDIEKLDIRYNNLYNSSKRDEERQNRDFDIMYEMNIGLLKENDDLLEKIQKINMLQ